MSDAIAEHGWTAVPVDAEAIFNGKPYLHKPGPASVKDFPFPSDDPIVAKTQAYAKEHLPQQTYNHSMRVFYWASIIQAQQFSSLTKIPPISPSTIALTALLHDLGTAPAFLTTTHLSFEFRGAIAAHAFLLSTPHAAPVPQTEAVVEAIIRHQDLGTTGAITWLGQLIQLATVYDNLGARPYLVHETTRGEVNEAFKREGWSGCFARTIREEVKAKPWAHSTHLGGMDGEGFANAVEGNMLMESYE
ncbi:hypothetical protein B0J18DRAFT_32755 [Chaetomium sp. MPI-SDFR-AT-0129]|nr:hypothetical protein B0J18DRAFT_32755 [Chaetomium sp. MPI-SDFR-AT-0129]